MALTTADVQTQLDTAITRLRVDILEATDELFVQKLTIAVGLLELMKAYSASANDIPGMRGLGLEQVLIFASEYVQRDKDVRMFNFNALYKALPSILV